MSIRTWVNKFVIQPYQQEQQRRRRNQSNAYQTKTYRRPPEVYRLLWKKWSAMHEYPNEPVEWDAILSQIQEDIWISSYCDEEHFNMLVLHFVCALRPPLNIVEALLDAYPDSVNQKSLTSEITPLMIACGRDASPEVIRCLVAAHIDAEEALNATSIDGYAPIHWACREDVSYRIVRELICIQPKVAMQQVQGERTYTKGITPIDILAQSSNDGNAANESSSSENKWEKIRLILHTLHYGNFTCNETQSLDTQSTAIENTILHPALALKGPESIILEALEREGDEMAIQRDQLGYLPLHYAVQWRFSKKHGILLRVLKANPDAAYSQIIVHDPFSSISISTLTEDFPLHMALKSGYTWSEGIKELFDCNKEAVGRRDAQYHLFPFALAASFSDLDATFHLLRALPELLAL